VPTLAACVEWTSGLLGPAQERVTRTDDSHLGSCERLAAGPRR
jgi:hypothetical protein